MTKRQIGLEAIEYGVTASAPLQEWLERGGPGQPPRIKKRADVEFFYAHRPGNGLLLVGFAGFNIRFCRGRAIDQYEGDFTGGSWAYAKSSDGKLTISIIEEPHGRPSGKKRAKFELSLVDAMVPTVFLPDRGAEAGWTREELKAQVCWWTIREGIGAADVSQFLTRYADRIWRDHGAAHLFDGSFKAPLSPLALKAHISFYRRLSVVTDAPASRLSYPARVRDMAYHLGVGERMLYRHAARGLIPSEISRGRRGREFLFLKAQEPRLVEFYREREQRKAILAGWKRARGVSDSAAREWVRWRLRRGDTLDQLEAEIKGLLKRRA